MGCGGTPVPEGNRRLFRLRRAATRGLLVARPHRWRDRLRAEGRLQLHLVHPSVRFRHSRGLRLGRFGSRRQKEAGLLGGRAAEGRRGSLRSMHAHRALRRRAGDHRGHANICSGTELCPRLLRIPPPSRDLPLRPVQVRAGEAQDRDPSSHQADLAKRAMPRAPSARNCGPATIAQVVQSSGTHLPGPMAYRLLSLETIKLFEFRNREGADDGMGRPRRVHEMALGARGHPGHQGDHGDAPLRQVRAHEGVLVLCCSEVAMPFKIEAKTQSPEFSFVRER